MKSLQIMKRDFNGSFIEQRNTDGYFNATTLLSSYNANNEKKKVIAEFWSNDSTNEFMKELALRLNIHKRNLYEARRGRGGCTWMHPYLFAYFSLWLDSKLGEKINNILVGDGIVKGLPILAYIRQEDIIIGSICKALSVSRKDFTFETQYPIGKYRADFCLYNINNPLDVASYLVVEYDEKHHNKTSNVIKDSDRIKDMVRILKAKHSNGKFHLEVIRVKEGQEGKVYAYLIPYLCKLRGNYDEYVYDNFEHIIAYSSYPELNIDITL